MTEAPDPKWTPGRPYAWYDPEADARQAAEDFPALIQWGMKRGGYVTDKTQVSRTAAAAIRGMWTFLLTAGGFGVTWLVDNFTTLDVPIWTGIIIGSLAYAAKKAAWPDTTF